MDDKAALITELKTLCRDSEGATPRSLWVKAQAVMAVIAKYEANAASDGVAMIAAERYHRGVTWYDGEPDPFVDAAFIAAAPEAIDFLLSEIERLTAEPDEAIIAAARHALRGLFGNDLSCGLCPNGIRPNDQAFSTRVIAETVLRAALATRQSQKGETG